MEQTWDKVSDFILYGAFAVLAVFAILGLAQLIQRRSLKKVDRPLLAMLAPLVLAVATYFIFDHFIVLNTRPNGSGEPSFPSSHVMFVATIFATVAIVLPYYIKSRPLCCLAWILMLALLALVSAGRILSNMHWLTDVLGALGFSAAFALIYYFTVKNSLKKQNKRKKE